MCSMHHTPGSGTIPNSPGRVKLGPDAEQQTKWPWPCAVEGLMYLAPACSLWLLLRMAAENALGLIAAKPLLYLSAAAMGFGVNSLAYIVIQVPALAGDPCDTWDCAPCLLCCQQSLIGWKRSRPALDRAIPWMPPACGQSSPCFRWWQAGLTNSVLLGRSWRAASPSKCWAR